MLDTELVLLALLPAGFLAVSLRPNAVRFVGALALHAVLALLALRLGKGWVAAAPARDEPLWSLVGGLVVLAALAAAALTTTALCELGRTCSPLTRQRERA